MPGLTLAVEVSVPEEMALERYRAAQRPLLHADDYRSRVEYSRGGWMAGYAGHPGYPFESIVVPGFWIGVEGEIYLPAGRSLREELEPLVDKIFTTPRETEPAVRTWIRDHDGDYLVAAIAEDGKRGVIFSDPSGRLPLFLHRWKGGAAVAREPKFLAALRGRWEYDRLGWGQYLWFGFTLGTRTLWNAKIVSWPAMNRP